MAASAGAHKSGSASAARPGLRAGTYVERREVGQRYLDRLDSGDRALFSRVFGAATSAQSVDSIRYRAKKNFSQASLNRLVKAKVIRKTTDGRYEVTGIGGYALEARRTV